MGPGGGTFATFRDKMTRFSVLHLYTDPLILGRSFGRKRVKLIMANLSEGYDFDVPRNFTQTAFMEMFAAKVVSDFRAYLQSPPEAPEVLVKSISAKEQRTIRGGNGYHRDIHGVAEGPLAAVLG